MQFFVHAAHPLSHVQVDIGDVWDPILSRNSLLMAPLEKSSSSIVYADSSRLPYMQLT